jgi:hypothetical protein
MIQLLKRVAGKWLEQIKRKVKREEAEKTNLKADKSGLAKQRSRKLSLSLHQVAPTLRLMGIVFVLVGGILYTVLKLAKRR